MPVPAPVRLRCEYHPEHLAIHRPDPRLSWQMTADGRDVVQRAYRITAAATEADLVAGKGLLWDSGKVASRAQAHIHWQGTPLTSFQRVCWRVQVWDGEDHVSAWSAPAQFAMGIRERASWGPARWIHSPISISTNSPYFRRRFQVTQGVTDARLYATARGIFRAMIDGQLVSDEEFAPGWTDYKKRILYRCHDVTRLLAGPGDHVLGAQLNDGWFKGPVGWEGKAHHWGGRTELLLLLRIQYADGSVTWVASDDQWRTANSPTIASSFLKGEVHDQGLEVAQWGRPGFDDASWHVANHSALEPELPSLDPHMGVPVRPLGELKPVDRWQPRPGIWIFDLGENIAGRVRIRVQAPAGTTIRLRHGEMVTPDRQLYVDNLRQALSTDFYTASGVGEEVYEPRFTFHGFQYVEVAGWPGDPPLHAITGVILGSDCPVAGEFSCSEPMVDRLYANLVRTQRANYLEIPTDCPQRDERLGWTGDAQAYIRTAICNRDIASFFTKWLQDLRDAQSPEGQFPNIAPLVPGLGESWGLLRCGGDAAWGDAGTICPWTMYRLYGDTDQLAEMYPAMVRWVEHLERSSVAGLRVRYERPGQTLVFGDWLQVDCWTPPEVIMTAFFAHSTQLTAQAAEVLGKTQDAKRWSELAAAIRAAFTKAFARPDGRVIGHRSEDETQTNYLLALHFDLLPEALRLKAVAHLVAAIEKRQFHLSTGFVGLPYLLPVLCRYGHVDIAYRLLMNRTYPSWLYPITQGATTIWERWNGWKKDSGPADPGMNSYSHYAYGAVGEWLFSDCAGIENEGIAFDRIRIRPRIGGSLTQARARHECLAGWIASSWAVEGGQVRLEVEIPPNTRARIHVPTTDAASLSEGGTRWSGPVSAADGYAVVEVGSGRYQFRAAYGLAKAAAR